MKFLILYIPNEWILLIRLLFFSKLSCKNEKYEQGYEGQKSWSL
jgi:hypothetical protein